ncbi:hypothetical protein [Evansella cellulosilytica]|uniref:LXG domain-containing protein n=1 Tax=Evansella cellulosilytica (strain ATCC 21833 / DSM 2522 / FERM P-1141 / JCM 9156 / N-4) TaxID=649639 RepID=E6TRH5_EVAC2|nr:hypothetical protein [Evansella cellulosilytica]ADU31805.1 hypothetical protein Bcell_3564 [Evansella cellulosilytica DSM 2522]
MSAIQIRVGLVNSTIPSLSNVVNQISDMKSGLSSLQYSLDNRIAARRNIRGRLNSVSQDLAKLESKMKMLEKFVGNSMQAYCRADDSANREFKEVEKRSISLIGALTATHTMSKYVRPFLNSDLFLRSKNGMNFFMHRVNGQVHLKLVGKRNGHTRAMLPGALGGTAKWGNGFWRKIDSKNGVLLYDKQHGYYKSNSNKFRNTDFDALSRSINNLGENKWSVATKTGFDTLKGQLKVWDDALNWKNSTTLSKGGKALGIFGTGFTVYQNASEHGIASKEFVVDTAVDIGSAAGAAAIGAAAGSFFLPPVGTVVGAGAGLVVNAGLNIGFGDPKRSIVDRTKSIANKAVDSAADWIGGAGESIKNTTSTAVNNIKKEFNKIFW